MSKLRFKFTYAKHQHWVEHTVGIQQKVSAIISYFYNCNHIYTCIQCYVKKYTHVYYFMNFVTFAFNK